jgi:hypothetical protein
VQYVTHVRRKCDITHSRRSGGTTKDFAELKEWATPCHTGTTTGKAATLWAKQMRLFKNKNRGSGTTTERVVLFEENSSPHQLKSSFV